MKSRTKLLIILSIQIIILSIFATDNYKYDSLNRLDKVIKLDGSIISYQYDEVGNRIGMVITKNSSTDLNQTSSPLGVKLYPNPTSENFSISGFEEYANIKLADISGKVVLAKQVTEYEIIPIGTLPKGVYIVEITTKMGVVKKKLLKK